MNQYPQSPDIAQQQPPTYHQDPNAQPQFQQGQMYQQPTGQQHPGSPPPQHGYASPPPEQSPGHFAPGAEQKGVHPQNPGMPPQQQSGTVYQNATPLMSLNRSPAPADCPACGQRAMTNTQFETGNTTQ
jgi:lipopolysaccharide-induced tumor necrosis factor-alpha factor